jgi:release factor glutamine methyltransferase
MNQTVATSLAAAQRTLPPIEARALLRHALGCGAAQLIAQSAQVLSAAQLDLISALIARRLAGEPIAYIVGAREFFSLEFLVTPAVLIPRPETELLVECAVARLSADRACDVLDLGTGSGCVAIAVAKERPLARVVGVDCSPAALAVAGENRRRHAVINLELLQSDWFSALAGRQFDLIAANAPYVAADDPHLARGDLRFEPRTALAAGADGLDCIRAIVAAAPDYLKSRGTIAFEHGYDQAENCRALLTSAGYVAVASHRELGGTERVTEGTAR